MYRCLRTVICKCEFNLVLFILPVDFAIKKVKDKITRTDSNACIHIKLA